MNRSDAVKLYTTALKEEIAEDDRLSVCKSFSELHDHTDANMLADAERGLIEQRFPEDEVLDIIAASQDLINIWLANGRWGMG
ncbi:hypothetical protein L3Y19_gp005 [Gordonia phage Neville]|uniref:Uncharacterized protein n=2 Tax=Nevillevirus TaxID=3044773 RepID=A0A515MGU3_9CAUD|nr:hypothetical protein L3Y19_gp005 [Gordonia phage Neville]YP_010245990.1 hypothetical protein L3Y20_gp005 [Gordonia phage Trax]AXQ64378.1 hypothetical protein SEA_NEVILLE_5 [Gordonia phage Neville]QDM55892.1 hypothetical protein SEA_TRAX_5 [Gordonia phage Trax]